MGLRTESEREIRRGTTGAHTAMHKEPLRVPRENSTSTQVLKSRMAVTVSSDLSVNVSEDQVVKKLTDKQEVLKESLRKGEPKAMGICQVMVGFMVISYSIPLLSAEFTQLVWFGVPWWSGLTFVAAGTMALVMEKRNSIQLVLACLLITIAAAFISVLALVFYFVDLLKNPEHKCMENQTNLPENTCEQLYHGSVFSKDMKSILMCLTVVQTGISSAFSYMLYSERKRFIRYSLVN
uniref:Transmembrane protein 176 n=1 Tax=Astyanax mexicanus TaxID=7994 RepID=W5KSJ2_ASTMX